MAKRKRRYVDIAAADFVPIVGDAAIAGPVAEGANIPLLILDTSERPDVEEIIRVQAHLPPGDVNSQWGGAKGDDDSVWLLLDFDRPVECRVALRFSIERQGILVDGVLQSRALYLQAGREGDRLKHDLDRPKMIVEVPDTGFMPKWNQLLLGRMTTVIRERSGTKAHEARDAATAMIAQMRELTTFRMPRG